eukprot:9492535-Pyramimonas_sp.AAC.1
MPETALSSAATTENPSERDPLVGVQRNADLQQGLTEVKAARLRQRRQGRRLATVGAWFWSPSWHYYLRDVIGENRQAYVTNRTVDLDRFGVLSRRRPRT